MGMKLDFTAIAAERLYAELQSANKRLQPHAFGRTVSAIARLLESHPIALV